MKNINSEDENEIMEDINKIYEYEKPAESNEQEPFYKSLTVAEKLQSTGDTKRFTILKKIILNICQNPKEQKFLELKLSNPNISHLVAVSEVLNYLLFMGFSRIELENMGSKSSESFLIMTSLDINKLNSCYSYLCLLESESASLINTNDDFSKQNSKEEEIERSQKILDYIKQTSTTQKKKESNNPKNDIRQLLKETSSIRSNQMQNQNTESGQNEFKWVNAFGNTADKEINDRDFVNKHNYQNNSVHKYTNESIIPYKGNDKFDEIGHESLNQTNQFRKKNGLNALEWDSEIWNICLTHSKNMGTGAVKFGHDGFNQRISSLPFHYFSASENVFMCSGSSESGIAFVAVNGWINSPGHRKNLLSSATHCAIATYKSGYSYYLTQIFVRK